MSLPSLLLAYDFPPMPGGIARALGEIAAHAAGRVVVSTGALETGPEPEWLGAAMVRRSRVARERLRTLPGLLAWAREASGIAGELGAGFAWAGNLKPAGYVARWLRARRRLPYGLIVYGLDLALLREQARRSWRKRMVARRILGGARGTVAISPWAADRFRELANDLGLPRGGPEVRVVPLGADPTRFHPGGPAATLGPGRWLLTVSRLVRHKGLDTAIRALAGLGPAHADVRLALAGSGPDLARLEALAAELGVGPRVRFLGSLPEAELPRVYRSATLVLGLSRAEGPEVEGFGLSLAEAQASGVPVVAARTGGIPAAVAEGESALLVPPDDPAAAREAVVALLDDPGRHRSFGSAGRRLVEQRLNWGRVVEELRGLEGEWGK